MCANFTYQQQEKLKSRKLIGQLFSHGKSIHIFPVKLIYLELKEVVDYPVKAGVGASSRNFKKATDRNRIKRLLREAYRGEKITLHNYLQAQNRKVVFFLLFTGKTITDCELIKAKMPLLMQRLIHELNENIAMGA